MVENCIIGKNANLTLFVTLTVTLSASFAISDICLTQFSAEKDKMEKKRVGVWRILSRKW